MLLALTATALASPHAPPDPPAAPPAWTVTVDPLTTALGYLHVQVERRLDRRVSLYAGPHLRLFDGVLTDGPEPFVGLGGELGVRFFPWGNAPTGPWIMARQVLAHVYTTDGPPARGVGGYTSALVGYTGLIGGRLVLSGGAGYNQLHYGVADYGTRGPFPALHTAVGVAF